MKGRAQGPSEEAESEEEKKKVRVRTALSVGRKVREGFLEEREKKGSEEEREKYKLGSDLDWLP